MSAKVKFTNALLWSPVNLLENKIMTMKEVSEYPDYIALSPILSFNKELREEINQI